HSVPPPGLGPDCKENPNLTSSFASPFLLRLRCLIPFAARGRDSRCAASRLFIREKEIQVTVPEIMPPKMGTILERYRAKESSVSLIPLRLATSRARPLSPHLVSVSRGRRLRT